MVDQTAIPGLQPRRHQHTVRSTKTVSASISASPDAVRLFLTADESTHGTELTVEGLRPNGDVYVFDGSYDQKTIGKTDEKGSFTFKQKLSTQERMVWIQPVPATIYLTATGGGCAQLGLWFSPTKVCTMTRNVSTGIVITGAGVTLNCNNYNIVGNRTGVGVNPTASSIAVRNCNIIDFDIGISVNTGVGGTQITGNDISVDIDGIVTLGPTTTIRDNTVTSYNDEAIHSGGSSTSYPNSIYGNTIHRMSGTGTYCVALRSNGNNVYRNRLGTCSYGIHTTYGSISVYENDITASTRGVYSTVAVNLWNTSTNHGNYWGHSCPSLHYFNPGVDSNSSTVIDSHPYGVPISRLLTKPNPPACGADSDGDLHVEIAQGGDDCDDAASTCTTTCTDTDGDGAYNCEDGCADVDRDNYGTTNAAAGTCTTNGTTACPERGACAGTDCNDSKSGCWSTCTDPDNDGYCPGDSGDCDNMAATGPSCHTGCSTFFRDADSDGRGDPSAIRSQCVAGDGYVANSSDCSDSKPGCWSTCTDPDNDGWCPTNGGDCDNLAATGSTCHIACPTFYRDADSDGRGDLSVSRSQCVAGDGYVANGSDCADSRPSCWSTCEDLDGDGWCPEGGDCDDSSETCTADCTTDVDVDGVPDCADGCIDSDGDGFGAPGGGANYTCGAPDCDDTLARCTTDCSTDTDGDLAVDCMDVDNDGDGICDPDVPMGTDGCVYFGDMPDNCPLFPNTDQSDRDDDGIGDVCDPASYAETIFSPTEVYPGSHLQRLVALIDATHRSIDIAIYSLADWPLLAALDRAVTRGVSVRLLFDDARENKSDPAGTWSALIETLGINVRYVNKTLHHKFAVFDGPTGNAQQAYTATLFTGSANWNNAARAKYDENTLILQNAELALRFQGEFNLLWENSRDLVWDASLPWEFSESVYSTMLADHPASDAVFTSTNFTTYVSPTYGPTFSYQSGSNVVSDYLVTLIGNATESVLLSANYLRLRPIMEALIAKHTADPSLDIRVYTDQHEYISSASHAEQEMEYQDCLTAAGGDSAAIQQCDDMSYYFSYLLHQSGIPVRFKTYAYRWDIDYARTMHDKYMIIDHSTVATGSYNYSKTSERDTMENVIVLGEPDYAQVVQDFVNNFETIWVTGAVEGVYSKQMSQIQNAPSFRIVFDSTPVALTWEEVTALKQAVAANCPDISTPAFGQQPTRHRVCDRYVTSQYDQAQRLTAVTKETGTLKRNVTLSYDAGGRLETVTLVRDDNSDAIGDITRFYYDGTGRLERKILADGRQIAYSYDAMTGELDGIQLPSTAVHAFGRNGLERTYTAPAVGQTNATTTYSLREAGQLATVTRPDGGVLAFVHDPTTSRVLTMTYPEGQTTVGYHPVFDTPNYVATADGQVIEHSGYGTQLRRLDISGDVSGAIEWEYNAGGMLQVVRTNGVVVTYQRQDGLLQGTADIVLVRDSSTTELLGASLGGLSDSWVHNSLGHLTDASCSFGGSALIHLQYAPDRFGFIKQRVEQVEGGPQHAYDFDYYYAGVDYTYGPLDRVWKNGVLVNDYDYDVNGNRLSTRVAYTSVGSRCDSHRVLGFVNDPGTSAAILANAGINGTSASAITARRDGQDGMSGTSDDELFVSYPDLRDVPQVGTAVVDQLIQIVDGECDSSAAPWIEVLATYDAQDRLEQLGDAVFAFGPAGDCSCERRGELPPTMNTMRWGICEASRCPMAARSSTSSTG